MERDFWAKRWSEGQIGFHEGTPNDLLVTHIARLETKRPLRVLVPLAGKTFDMQWLAARGHEVVGVEFVSEAISAFFSERGVEPSTADVGGMPASSAGGVTLVCGDILDVTPAALGAFDVIYDRAALIALDPTTRGRYADVMRAMRAERGVIFLIAFGYDQTKAPGPPWSASEEVVRELYPGDVIEVLSTRSVPTSTKLTAAGIPALAESAYWIAAPEAAG